MSARLISANKDTVTMQVEVKLGGSMLEMEAGIQDAINEVGVLATGEALHRFDTDGTAIDIGGENWPSKGRLAKVYQTPYGEIDIDRHVYQRSKGGKTYCPMERGARIVVTSTPRFAMQVSHKFVAASSTQVRRGLAENHGRAWPARTCRGSRKRWAALLRRKKKRGVTPRPHWFGPSQA